MPKENSSYLEMAYSSVNVFSDDGKLDESELNFLLGLALKDGEIDDDEKRVLKNIFDQIKDDSISVLMQDRLKAVREKYSI
ncbi:MAG: hypothetical protein KAI43_09070 [Candidatus Aureabacteria bacterium]|nr:hypothetical protein [Candidatus Auribacterota bacterium]